MKEVSTIEELDAITAESKTVVYFSAAWCGPCKTLSPIVAELAEEETGAKIVKVDVDNSLELSQKYSIRSIPALVLIVNQQEQKRLIGSRSKNDIVKDFELSAILPG